MIPVRVPTSDVNSDTGTIVRWMVPDRARVKVGERIVEIETSKAVIEVDAEQEGVLLQGFAAGARVQLADPIGNLFSDEASADSFAAAKAAEAALAPAEGATRATAKARARAAELGVDLESIRLDRMVNVQDVEEAAAASLRADASLPALLTAPAGHERVLLIGGSRAATQVIEIFHAAGGKTAVGILDDNRAIWGESVEGVPVCGGTSRLQSLFEERLFDRAIIAISTSVEIRRKFRLLCESLGIPLTNAIDPSVRIARDVQMGEGNIICAFCHFGTGSVVGHNNFLSAYNSFDHHSIVSSDASTGPACIGSGRVILRDRVRLGAGIFMEPGVELGEGVRVASGSILVKSVPAGHAVKTKIVTTVVVPLKG